MEALVLKVSESGKSIFVGVRLNQFDQTGIAGYCANPGAKYKKGDVINDFPQVEGTVSKSGKDGKVLSTKTGEPLRFLQFRA